MTSVLPDTKELATLYQVQHKLTAQGDTLIEVRGLLAELVALIARGLTVPDLPAPVVNVDSKGNLSAADIAAALAPLVERPNDSAGSLDNLNRSLVEIREFLKKGPQIVRVGGGGGSQIQLYDASSGISVMARVLTGDPPPDAAGLVVRLANASVAVTGGLTDAQLRATPVPVSNASLPLPTGAAKDSTLTDGTQRVGGTVAVSGTFWQATQPVSGTVTANAGTGTRIADVQFATPQVVTGTGGALNDTPIAATEVKGRWVSVQFSGAPSLTVIFEQSNDNTNWQNVRLDAGLAAGNGTVASVTNPVATNIYSGPIVARYFRCRVSAWTSGTVTATAVISSMPGVFSSQPVDTELAAGVAAGDSVSNPTVPQVLSHGMLWNGTNWERQKSGSTGAGRVESSFLFSNITTATTTTIKSGAGLLHAVVINTRGVASTATVYDNTAGSGTKIATIDTTLSTTAFLYDAAFATGLTVVTVGTADLTFTYR
ncbi:MAG: hypothetical protein LC750_07490 [Actinobacteria bacterium]|nr:hypothetical protein [Actinomycetota bacterium]